jgi:molybdate/tungstate transport system substrate-binding protein
MTTMERKTGLSRREILKRSGSLIGGAMAAGFPARLLAEELAELDVASAGSIRPVLEGPFKTAVARSLKMDLHTHAEGADAVARSIVAGNLRADIFVPITASPMLTVMRAGKTETAQPIARTELVLVYSPKSRFAPQFEAAANGIANWWEVLQEQGMRIGRGNPAADPGARAILFAMMLAAKKYNQPNLVEKVLGPVLNPAQIIPGVQARLQSGELDASASYKVGVGWSKLPYIVLSNDVNLSRDDVHTKNPEVSFSIGDKTYYPEPLVFYAALLKGGANPTGASAFLEWVKGSEAQTLFRQHQYDPPGDTPALHA